MNRKPSTSPAMGDVTIGTITFQSSPLPSHQCRGSACDQMMTCQLFAEAAKAAPQRPPMSAWLELEGSPNHQVRRFHAIAPSKAQMMMSEVIETIFASTSPEE